MYHIWCFLRKLDIFSRGGTIINAVYYVDHKYNESKEQIILNILCSSVWFIHLKKRVMWPKKGASYPTPSDKRGAKLWSKLQAAAYSSTTKSALDFCLLCKKT